MGAARKADAVLAHVPVDVIGHRIRVGVMKHATALAQQAAFHRQGTRYRYCSGRRVLRPGGLWLRSSRSFYRAGCGSRGQATTGGWAHLSKKAGVGQCDLGNGWADSGQAGQGQCSFIERCFPVPASSRVNPLPQGSPLLQDLCNTCGSGFTREEASTGNRKFSAQPHPAALPTLGSLPGTAAGQWRTAHGSAGRNAGS
ncbi:hypothetical protein D3C79_643050 [compost metagenome]